MENGLVIGKALREITKDEELVVSYKAHYMRHTKQERKQFLLKLKMECFCKYCEMDDEEEPCVSILIVSISIRQFFTLSIHKAINRPLLWTTVLHLGWLFLI